MDVHTICVADLSVQSVVELDEFFDAITTRAIDHPFVEPEYPERAIGTLGIAQTEYLDRDTYNRIRSQVRYGALEFELILESDGLAFSRYSPDTPVEAGEIAPLALDLRAYIQGRLRPVRESILKYDLNQSDLDHAEIKFPVLLFVDNAIPAEVEAFFADAEDRSFRSHSDFWIGSRHVVISGPYDDDLVSFLSFALCTAEYCERQIRISRWYWKRMDEILGEFTRHHKLKNSLDRANIAQAAMDYHFNSLHRIHLAADRRLLQLRYAAFDTEIAGRFITDKITETTHVVDYVEQKFQLLLKNAQAVRERLDNYYKNASMQKMDWLQSVFLTSTIAAIIALGAMPGSILTTYGPDGNEINRIILEAFDFRSFALIAALVVGVTLGIRIVTRQLNNWLIIRRDARNELRRQRRIEASLRRRTRSTGQTTRSGEQSP